MTTPLPPLPEPMWPQRGQGRPYVDAYSAQNMAAYAQQARADLEAENARLREALESARGALCGAISKVRENPNLAESTCRHGLHKIDVALKETP